MQMVDGGRGRGLRGAALGLLIISALAMAIPTAADVAPTRTSASIPQVVHFTGVGFVANETISFWLTAPDHFVIPLNQGQADSLGAFSITVPLTGDGAWQATAYGMMSKHEVITSFVVGMTGTVTVPPQLPATDTPVPSPQPVAGQTVTISDTIFGAGENVSLWITAPDGKTRALPVQQADNNGALTTYATFDSSGYWQVTAHGQSTGYERVHGFTVASAPTTTPTPPATPTVASALPNAVPGTITNQPLPAGQQPVTPSAP